tara:strand:- start:545 stop:1072 length:528 start_codon:yes stop_codon:yes gene_type:complete
MTLEYEILDDLISIGMQDYIERTVADPDFPWYYTESISLSNTDDDSNSGFSHTVFREGYKGPYSDMLLPVLYTALGDIPLKNLLRIRLGMFIKEQNPGDHKEHVDQPEHIHKTMLYYINDADGPTNIYDKKGGNIIEQVEFKKGRCLVLDGKVYHSSSSPKTSPRRLVANFNFQI